MDTSAVGTTLLVSLPALFAGFESVVPAGGAIVAVFVMGAPTEVTVAVTLI
jgi:hypothetical protein